MPGPGNVGERVRNLRLTRRLSQAQLAGHDLSDSYISLIESGKRTPTPAVLRLLAERLGCTPEYLAEGIEPEQRAHLEVRERYARLALRTGESLIALSGFDDVIAGSDDPELTARARWGRANALERLGRIEAAIGVFEELREQAERDPGRSSSLPALVALARCYHAVGDLGQAIALGERVLSRLHELELNVGREHTEAGRVLLLAYVDRSDPERAHQLGRKVLAVGETGEALVAAAYRRASAHALDEGTVGEALYLADQALATQGERARSRAQARLHVAAARALLRGVAPFGEGSDPASEALRLLKDAAPSLEGAEAIGCAIESARALVLLGKPEQAISAVERQLGDPGGRMRAAGASGTTDPADHHHHSGYGKPDAAAEANLRALQLIQARLVLGRARLAQDDRDAALVVLRDAAERLDRLGRPAPGRPAAYVLRELGELFEAAGDGAGATSAYRRALEAAGLRPTARPLPATRDLGRV